MHESQLASVLKSRRLQAIGIALVLSLASLAFASEIDRPEPAEPDRIGYLPPEWQWTPPTAKYAHVYMRRDEGPGLGWIRSSGR